jgi:hypothetical protein
MLMPLPGDGPGRGFDSFLPVLDETIGSGLVTLEKVQVLQYGGNRTHPLGEAS